jgi:nucleotide-binding universal stress UspA family protein
MLTNIVWATDGSEHADRALEYAAQMAQGDGATLHVAHVIETLVGPRMAGQRVHLDEAQIDGKIKGQTATLAAQAGVKTRLHMTADRAGEVAQQTFEIACENGADVIVVGTRGHSALAGVMLGSVTQRLLHVAHCPVLAVPPLDAESIRADGPEAATAAT